MTAKQEPDPNADGGPSPQALAARWLRGIGALVLLASLVTLLLQGWSAASDLGRFGLMLGQTGLFLTAGLASGRYLREPKGARLFIAVSLVAVVANFAVLGGLIWSAYGNGNAATEWSALAWQTEAGPMMLVVAAGATLALAAVTRLGFTVMARSAGRTLTLALLASAATLIVPTRAPWLIAALIAAAAALASGLATHQRPRRAALRTTEGAIALSLPFLPPGILVGRSLLFHDGAALVATLGSVAAYLLLRELAVRRADDTARAIIDMAAVACAIAAGLLGRQAVLAEPSLTPEASLPIGGLLTGGLLLELSTRACRHASIYRLAGVLTATLALAGNVWLSEGAVTAVAAMLVGLLASTYAVYSNRLWLLAPAVPTTLSGLGELVSLAIGSVAIGAWGWLALAGTLAILGGSVLERIGLASCLHACRYHLRHI